jgi:hypothetical protein
VRVRARRRGGEEALEPELYGARVKTLYGKLASFLTQGGTVSVDKALARDNELRDHATPRPWHQSGVGTRLRLVGPLPQATVIVDPYAPNPQDAPLILHRVNTYEDLEIEIERLREALRDARARLDSVTRDVPSEQMLDALTRDLGGRIDAALGDRRARVVLPRRAGGRSPLAG